VVPIFRKQIEAGGPVTVTHPEMRRFFMTIPEASQLVMQAGAIGQGGDFCAGHGGAGADCGPGRGDDPAQRAASGEDIAIEFTGIRPGEKLSEELAGQNEQTRPTSHPKIRIWQLPPATALEANRMVADLERAVRGSRREILSALQRAVREYQCGQEVAPLRIHAAAA
jgi:FlaA1/EpsC-like NDP-sugar epimerase